MHPTSESEWGNTLIIEAPCFDEEPASPDSIDAAAFKRRLWDRLASFLWQRAPQFLESLETTFQQCDRAIAEYERRQSELKSLVQTAEAVQQELRKQREACLVELELQEQESPVRFALSNDVDELERQANEQDQQLEEMRLQQARIKAKVEQLCSQRDILNARLKAAQARLRTVGGQRPKPERHPVLRGFSKTPGRKAAALGVGILIIALGWIASSRLGVFSGTPQPIREAATSIASQEHEASGGDATSTLQNDLFSGTFRDQDGILTP